MAFNNHATEKGKVSCDFFSLCKKSATEKKARARDNVVKWEKKHGAAWVYIIEIM